MAVVYADWHVPSSPPDAADVQAIPSVALTCMMRGQQTASFAHVPPAPASPLDDPLLDPLEEPLLDPLDEPLEEPLPPPLPEPPLDPLDEPLEEPLLDPLEEPLLLPPPSLAVDASSPVPKPVFGLLLDEHAASNPNTPLDAHTNLFILRIVLSSTGLCRAARQAPARCPKRAL